MRCSMCGHDSPFGSAFCLNCGGSLAPAFGQTPAPAQGLPTVCGVCRGENPPNMKFCRNCGSALAGGGPSAVPLAGTMMQESSPAAIQELIAQSRSQPTPAGMPPAGVIGGPMPARGAQMPPHGAFPPPGSYVPPAPATTPPSVGPTLKAPPSLTCPRCNTVTPVGFAFCQQCGFHMQAQAASDPARPALRASGQGSAAVQAPVDVQAATIASDGARAGLSAPRPGSQVGAAPHQGPSWGTAVLVNRDGSDGQRFSLVGEYLVIGRTGSDIEFSEDRFLARQHARLERAADGGVTVHPMDALNGVFRKADAPVDLVDGTTILVGREVLRYERVEGEELKVHPLVRHGVALFGSPPREPWGRLVAIVPSGGYRDVRHMAEKEVVLGREEGDIIFRDDAFMSRRHAAVTWDGRKAQITDLGSSNGTFIRVLGPTPLKNGDHVRMGDQLLRIELGR